jgi:hypothetical protein
VILGSEFLEQFRMAVDLHHGAGEAIPKGGGDSEEWLRRISTRRFLKIRRLVTSPWASRALGGVMPMVQEQVVHVPKIIQHERNHHFHVEEIVDVHVEQQVEEVVHAYCHPSCRAHCAEPCGLGRCGDFP